MPIPKPKESETRTNFITRFIGDAEMISEYPVVSRRLAVAYSVWKNRNQKAVIMYLENKKYESINFKPTQEMSDNAKRGLKMRSEQPPSNRGGTAVGLARARQLVNRETLSPETVKRMYSFFSRHEVAKQSESWKEGNSKGEQAWLLWGGNAGFSWSKRKVEQMKKEDEKKGGVNLGLEYKGLQLEIKAVGEDGTFEGMASPYNNIDLGNDRVLPSIAGKNANKKNIPYLWQHDDTEPIGKVDLIATQNGIELKGKLFLDTNDKGIPTIPNAHKAYTLMKNGMLKNSIGYNTLDYEYVKEGDKTIRNLKNIDIMEVSGVTFPMNPEATITNIKNKGGQEMEIKREEFDALVKNVEALTQLVGEQKAKDEEYNMIKGYIEKMDPKDKKYKNLFQMMLDMAEDMEEEKEEKKDDTIEKEEKSVQISDETLEILRKSYNFDMKEEK